MQNSHYFKVAEHNVCINLIGLDDELLSLIPSFLPFILSDRPDELLFELDVLANLEPVTGGELIRECVTGNGYTVVYKFDDGSYQYIIKDIKKNDCCLLITNSDFSKCKCVIYGDKSQRSFGLNNALMLIYAFAGSYHDTLLIHASCPINNGYAYPFIAQSGTGKSTHSSLWLKNIPDTELLNDDNPVVRVLDGTPYVFGSPWSGKTPCYRSKSAKLGAITRISRADRNYVEKHAAVQAFASFLPSCSSMKWDKTIYKNICDTIVKIIGIVPVYTMHCLPDDEAAHVCYNEISR